MPVCAFCLFGIDIITFLTDLGVFFALYLIVSLSLNLEAGFAGVPNFGKVLFVAAGAAISGSVCGRLAAIILGVDTLGDFAGQTARIMPKVNAVLQNNIPLSFGLLLLGILPDVFKWAEALGLRDIAVLGVVSVFAVLVYVYLERTARSPLGRTLRAVRDNEVASRALGKDDVAIRRNVIIVASAISAMAGALLTFYAGSVGSETWTRLEWTFWIWVMVIMGGAANNGGVALGSFSFLFLFKTLDIVKLHVQLPVDMNWIEYILFASILISVLIFRPGGILPEKSSKTLPRETVAAIMETRRRDDGRPKEQAAATLQAATPDTERRD